MYQPKLDPCLFVGDKVICIVDVDDLIFWAKDRKDIHDMAIKLREAGVDMEKEDDSAGFSGVILERNYKTRLIAMRQYGLIERIVESLGLYDVIVTKNHTPLEGKSLVKNKN